MRTVFWQKHPAFRLLLPLIAGIYSQQYLPQSTHYLITLFLLLLTAALVYQYLQIERKYFLTHANGMILQLLIFTAGLLLAWKSDCRNDNLFGNGYNPGMDIIATLDEPLSEKAKSYKAVATVQLRFSSSSTASGKVILYFKKDSPLLKKLSPGSNIFLRKQLQEIRNNGNPGGFDYKKYCFFRGITHQVYLENKDFAILPARSAAFPRDLVFSARESIISVIRTRIEGKKQQGLAEALLIGYRDDLDKSLVQAYSNTGVVHVIAISGLHLGIIYTILLFVTSPFNRKRWYWLRFFVVIGGLWSFSLLAAAQASVLRSAVMFSFIAAGAVLKKNTSVLNSLALSAFLLLSWKPYWLWDVGFQLSYTAVLSIVLFFRYVYGWIYLKSKVADFFWKMTAVTISAQFLTLPLTLYYFQQFPVLLLFTNFVAVPLSSIILIGEIALVATHGIPVISSLIGRLLTEMIRWMNRVIEEADRLPFSTWEGLSISELQVSMLYVFVFCGAGWLLYKEARLAIVALVSVMIFVCSRSYSFVMCRQQQKLVVYNIPKIPAADLISGKEYIFLGDTSGQKDPAIGQFHLQPSRRKHRVYKQGAEYSGDLTLVVKGKTVVFTSGLSQAPKKCDVLIISGKARVETFEHLLKMKPAAIVLDGSVPFWNAVQWKNASIKLNIHIHHVAEHGAFVMNF